MHCSTRGRAHLSKFLDVVALKTKNSGVSEFRIELEKISSPWLIRAEYQQMAHEKRDCIAWAPDFIVHFETCHICMHMYGIGSKEHAAKRSDRLEKPISIFRSSHSVNHACPLPTFQTCVSTAVLHAAADSATAFSQRFKS